jgi:hypothetical protein
MSTIGEPEVFSYAKSSRNIGNIVTGNLTYQQAVSIGSIPRVFKHWLDPNEYVTQQDAKSMSKAMWLPNVLGMRNYVNRMIESLPKSQPALIEEE